MKEIIKDKAVAYNFNSIVMLNLFQHLKIKRFRNKFGMTFGRAFTLAEVLITLTIIGVIAALTIPNLMRKYEDHKQVNALKTAYSLLSNAYKMALAENGPVADWEWPKLNPTGGEIYENAEYFGSVLAKYLKVQKYCGRNEGCFSYGHHLNGNNRWYFMGVAGSIAKNGSQYHLDYGNGGRMVLNNGMRIYVYIYSPVHSYNTITVDTNGTKGPNRVGYDVFYLGIRENGLTPQGGYYGTAVSACNPTKGIVSGSPADGASCAYWVLRKGNMDYKYRDVSAEW